MLVAAYLEKGQIARAQEFYRRYTEKGFRMGADIEERLGASTDARAGHR